jgi:hypothetical protein
MEEIQEAGFDDFSQVTEQERLSFAIEQAVERWILAYMTGSELPGQVLDASNEQAHATAVEGVRRFYGWMGRRTPLDHDILLQ